MSECQAECQSVIVQEVECQSVKVSVMVQKSVKLSVIVQESQSVRVSWCKSLRGQTGKLNVRIPN